MYSGLHLKVIIMKHPWDLPPAKGCFLIHIHRALCLAMENIRWAFLSLFFRIFHKNADQEWKSEATPCGQPFVSWTVCSFIGNKDTAGVHILADVEKETLKLHNFPKKAKSNLIWPNFLPANYGRARHTELCSALWGSRSSISHTKDAIRKQLQLWGGKHVINFRGAHRLWEEG